MTEYARLTGFPEMPPLWSLGYQQSHRTLGSPDEILAEAKEFRRRKLPCDAFIYLGTGFSPNGWNTDNGEFICRGSSYGYGTAYWYKTSRGWIWAGATADAIWQKTRRC